MPVSDFVSHATAQRIVLGCWCRSFDVRMFFAICCLLSLSQNERSIPPYCNPTTHSFADLRNWSVRAKTDRSRRLLFFVLSSAAGVMLDVSIDRALVTGNRQPGAGAESESAGGSFIAHAGVHLCLADSQKIAQDVPADSKTGDGQSHTDTYYL